MDQKLRIILAEDNRGDVILVEEALRCYALDYALQVCRDGDDMTTTIKAIDAGEIPCPDVVLLDLNLPVHNGHTLLRQLRDSSVCQHVPVIIVTSSDAPRDREQTLQLGANHYFRKPSDYDQFMQLGSVVKEVLQQNAVYRK